MKTLEARTFEYNDRPYKSELLSNRIQTSDGTMRTPYNLLFSEYVDEDAKKWVFDNFGNEWMVKAQDSYGYEDPNPTLDFFDIEFARFLAENRIPAHLAIRLAIHAKGATNGEELFRNYRNLKVPFFFNTSTGESAFEYYVRVNRKFGPKVADKIIVKAGSSLESIRSLFYSFMDIRIHPAASEYISNLGPEPFEAFVIFSKFMYFEKKQDAVVITRLLAETDDFNWDIASRLVDRLNSDGRIDDLTRPEEKHLSRDFQNPSYRRDIIRGFRSSSRYGSDSTGDWNSVFAILIEKYGMQMILTALEKMKTEVDYHDQTFSTFVIVADYIHQSQDYDTPAAWILSLNGEVEDELVEDEL